MQRLREHCDKYGYGFQITYKMKRFDQFSKEKLPEFRIKIQGHNGVTATWTNLSETIERAIELHKKKLSGQKIPKPKHQRTAMRERWMLERGIVK